MLGWISYEMRLMHPMDNGCYGCLLAFAWCGLQWIIYSGLLAMVFAILATVS